MEMHMSIEISDPNPPTNASSIAAFEVQAGVELPRSYKSFLLLTNGGRPSRTYFDVKNRPFSPEEALHYFLGLGITDYPTLDLLYPLNLYAGGIPSEVVPIANEDGGSYICLDLRHGGERVVYWDKAHFWSTGEWREDDLYPIADSFAEFLSLLRPSPH